jgi:hypothetical protein
VTLALLLKYRRFRFSLAGGPRLRSRPTRRMAQTRDVPQSASSVSARNPRERSWSTAFTYKTRWSYSGRTHLYSSLSTSKTPGLGATLDLLLMATTRQHSLLVLRRQLVSHARIVLRRPHVGHHLLVRRRMRMRLVAVVLGHSMRRRRKRRAHRLLLCLLLLGRWRLLSILDAYWRQIERRQRHVGALRRPSIDLIALLLTLGRRIRVSGLH